MNIKTALVISFVKNCLKIKFIVNMKNVITYQFLSVNYLKEWMETMTNFK